MKKDVTKPFTVGDNRPFLQERKPLELPIGNACIAPRSATTVLLDTVTSTCNIHLFRSFSGKSNLHWHLFYLSLGSYGVLPMQSSLNCRRDHGNVSPVQQATERQKPRQVRVSCGSGWNWPGWRLTSDAPKNSSSTTWGWSELHRWHHTSGTATSRKSSLYWNIKLGSGPGQNEPWYHAVTWSARRRRTCGKCNVRWTLGCRVTFNSKKF